MSIFANVDAKSEMESVLKPSMILNYVPRWPLFMQLFCIVLCFMCSVFYHMFHHIDKCHEEKYAQFDYGGIAFLIMGSCMPPIIYPFACEPLYEARNFFIILILTTSSLTFLSLFHPTL